MTDGTRQQRIAPSPIHAKVIDGGQIGERYWLNSQPLPMVGRPVTCEEEILVGQLSRLPEKPQVWCWSDEVANVPWSMQWLNNPPSAHPASVAAALDAWVQQNPGAWLVVDTREGRAPNPEGSLEETLRSLPVNVILLVESVSDAHPFPPWDYPL